MKPILKYKQFFIGVVLTAVVALLVNVIPNALDNLDNKSEEAAYDMNYSESKVFESDNAYASRGSEESAFNLVVDDQKMIYSSSMNIEVELPKEVVSQIEQLLNQYGSYIESINSYVNPEYTYYVEKTKYYRQETIGYNLTIRVKSDKLDEFIDAIEALGDVTSFSKSAYNVTERYTDLESRLQLHQSKLTRLNELFAETASLSELITLENAISEEIYQIDNIMSQLKGLDKEINYSSLYLNITEKEETTLTVTKTNFFKEVGDSVIISINAFVANLILLVKAVIYIIPYTLIIALLYFLYKRVKR